MKNLVLTRVLVWAVSAAMLVVLGAGCAQSDSISSSLVASTTGDSANGGARPSGELDEIVAFAEELESCASGSFESESDSVNGAVDNAEVVVLGRVVGVEPSVEVVMEPELPDEEPLRFVDIVVEVDEALAGDVVTDSEGRIQIPSPVGCDQTAESIAQTLPETAPQVIAMLYRVEDETTEEGDPVEFAYVVTEASGFALSADMTSDIVMSGGQVDTVFGVENLGELAAAIRDR